MTMMTFRTPLNHLEFGMDVEVETMAAMDVKMAGDLANILSFAQQI